MNDIKILIENSNKHDHEELLGIIEILMKDRIEIVKSDMNALIGLDDEPSVNKERITKCIKLLNNYAAKNNIDFNIDENWETIELFLRNTILDDLAAEFKRQRN